MIRLKRFLCRVGIHIEDAVYYVKTGVIKKKCWACGREKIEKSRMFGRWPI